MKPIIDKNFAHLAASLIKLWATGVNCNSNESKAELCSIKLIGFG
jgi:hypothetical protein